MRVYGFGVTQKEAITVINGPNIRFWWKGQAEDENRTKVRDIDHVLLLP